MSLIPDSVEKRKFLNGAINEAVDSKLRQDAEKTLQAEIKGRVEEETGMSKSEFGKRVALRYKQITDPQGYREDVEWFDSVFEENDILAKVK